MSTIELMQQRLSVLAPEALEIGDDSAKHAGHEGAKGGGGHYNLTIVSPQFNGMLTVARHRMIYNALGDLMQTKIHALSIRAFAPGEL
jgi:BolA protein